jgi:hypothetical protein
MKISTWVVSWEDNEDEGAKCLDTVVIKGRCFEFYRTRDKARDEVKLLKTYLDPDAIVTVRRQYLEC